jgi:hypothetical protein
VEHQLGVRLSPEDAAKLERVAFEDDLTVSAWTRNVMLRWLASRRGAPEGIALVRYQSRLNGGRTKFKSIRFRPSEVEQIAAWASKMQISMAVLIHRVVCRALAQRRPTNGVATTSKDEEE